MKYTALPILLLAISMPMFAQTTYSQDSVISWRGGGPTFAVYGAQFIAPDGTLADLDTLRVWPNYACNGQTAPIPGKGYVIYTVNGVGQPCAPVLDATYGPTISVISIVEGWKHTCTGVSSVHIDFVGGSFDVPNITYEYKAGSGRAGGGAGCYAVVVPNPPTTLTLN